MSDQRFELGQRRLIALGGHLEIHLEVTTGFDQLLVVSDRRLDCGAFLEQFLGLLSIVPEVGILASLVEVLEPALQPGEVKDAARGGLSSPSGR